MRRSARRTQSAGRHARRTVRVPARELVRLLRDALRASELEQEIAAAEAATRRAQACTEARQAVEAALASGGLSSADVAVGALVDDPPVDARGRLHRPALLALLEVRIWDLRLEQALAGSARGGAR